MEIKNCSTFVVFRLPNVPSCPSAYCFESNLPCETTSTSTTRTTTTTVTHSKAEPYIPSSEYRLTAKPKEYINSNKQSMCYSCEDMSNMELCDKVKKCGDGEICSTYYPSSSNCAECCNTDYCNGRECGDAGLVSRHERGPLCYESNRVRTIGECTSIRPCNKHQSCSIEEFEWLDHTHLIIGCMDLPCSDIRSGLLRSSPRCKTCCDQDFCNTNCTHHQPIGIIG
ncbi:uncharacterized protein LOC127836054 isoform X2 [Dreissena polymorpha]|nr:uncharacterized protein LOC127836054 isoform X2 [Dreissena polymorpha]